MAFNPSSAVPVAAVCLNDTRTSVEEACYGFEEALAHLIWYREKSPTKPNEPAAVFYARFYATATASALYAAGEHIADAVLDMLEIDRCKLVSDEKSLQSKVVQYLQQELPAHDISSAVRALGSSEHWRKTMTFRHRWVHSQPATVAGLGIVHTRSKKWETFTGEDGSFRHVLRVGGGDTPEYTIDEIIRFVGPAMTEFVRLFETVVSVYECLLSNAGIIFNPSNDSAGGADKAR
jgi:hypothetical protein